MTLRLKQGNDETIKRHLASKLREARDGCDALRQRLSKKEEELGQAGYTNGQLMQDIGQRDAEISGIKDEIRRMGDAMRVEE
jgi:hypothetical protein